MKAAVAGTWKIERRESEQDTKRGKAREEPACRKWWELEKTIMRGSSGVFLRPVVTVDVFGKEAMAGSHGFMLRQCQETDSSPGCLFVLLQGMSSQILCFCTCVLQFLGSCRWIWSPLLKTCFHLFFVMWEFIERKPWNFFQTTWKL